MTKPFEFQVGDIVSLGGLGGKVTAITDEETYPVSVLYTDGNVDMFTLDGRWKSNHTEPLLKLIERPSKGKPKLKAYLVNWESPMGRMGVIFDVKDPASHNGTWKRAEWLDPPEGE